MGVDLFHGKLEFCLDLEVVVVEQVLSSAVGIRWLVLFGGEVLDQAKNIRVFVVLVAVKLIHQFKFLILKYQQ